MQNYTQGMKAADILCLGVAFCGKKTLSRLTFAFTIELGNLIESGEKVFRKIKKHGYLEKSIVRFVLDLIKPVLLHCISQGLFSKKHYKFLFPEKLLKLVG